MRVSESFGAYLRGLRCEVVEDLGDRVEALRRELAEVQEEFTEFREPAVARGLLSRSLASPPRPLREVAEILRRCA